MKIEQTSISGLLIFEPRVFEDDRGFFLETYNERSFAEGGVPEKFVQDNHSFSARNVVRGLHYQIQQAQGKLVRVVVGEILDVAVDLRKRSSTFGKWVGVKLSGDNKKQLWIPPGFAHGFRVISETAHVLYKTTDFYAPQAERTIRWNDPDLAIEWDLDSDPIVSAKDRAGVSFREAEAYE